MKRQARPDARLSIGALSRATGIPVETLRTWELRYGFPVPDRKPSGHRVYPASIVPRLLRVNEALRRGHRAGEAVPASDSALGDLLAATPERAPEREPVPSGPVAPALVDDLLQTVQAIDAPRLAHLLLADSARLGVVEFLERRVAPLVDEIGQAWEEGRLDVRHEHFLSERVSDLLRSMRLPYEDRATGPLMVLATLPGEQHGLGMQMAALVAAAAGCRVLVAGTDVPLTELVTLARDVEARAVAISISKAAPRDATVRQVVRLRARLPRRAALILGGSGAPAPRKGLEVMTDLRALDDWCRRESRAVPAAGAARRP